MYDSKFTLMPTGALQLSPSMPTGTPQLCPWGIVTGLPPADNVARTWHYDPCPPTTDNFQMGATLITTLLDPRHLWPGDNWLLLFPKKLDTEVECVARETAWGIHITDGLNPLAVAWISFLVFLSSGVLGLVYSIATKDPGAAFTIAAWFAGTMGAGITVMQISAARKFS